MTEHFLWGTSHILRDKTETSLPYGRRVQEDQISTKNGPHFIVGFSKVYESLLTHHGSLDYSVQVTVETRQSEYGYETVNGRGKDTKTSYTTFTKHSENPVFQTWLPSDPVWFDWLLMTVLRSTIDFKL